MAKAKATSKGVKASAAGRTSTRPTVGAAAPVSVAAGAASGGGMKINKVWLGILLVGILALVTIEVSVILKKQVELNRTMTCVGVVGKRADINVPGTFKGTYLERINRSNRLYHIDENFNKIIVYDLSNDTLAFEIDPKKAGQDNFVPRDVAEDMEGNIYVFDAGAQQIAVFSPQGEFQRRFQITNANSLALDEKGNLFYVNPAEKQVFKVDSQTGKVITFFGRKQLRDPWRLETDKNGNVYVLDKILKKVVVFDKNGKFKHAWSNKIENVDYARIQIVGDKAYINDFGGHTVNIYSLQGKLISKIQVHFPGPMGVDQEGRIYLAGPEGVMRYSLNEN